MITVKRYITKPDYCPKKDFAKCLCHRCLRYDICDCKQVCKKSCDGSVVVCETFKDGLVKNGV